MGCFVKLTDFQDKLFVSSFCLAIIVFMAKGEFYEKI